MPNILRNASACQTGMAAYLPLSSLNELNQDIFRSDDEGDL
jgi:hypothetical protein